MVDLVNKYYTAVKNGEQELSEKTWTNLSNIILS